MSYEAEQENQDGAGDGTENADDLSMALSGGETSFVSETKQPMSKGTMVVAGLLIACGAVTYFMYIRTGPDAASASPEQAKAEQIVKGFIDDPSRAKGWKELIESTDKVVKQFKQDVVQVPLTALAGNPFEKEKPKPKEEDAAKRKLEEIERAKAAAKEAIVELKLQTIIHRDPKKAAVMINNSMYRKGGKISVLEGKVVFTVEDIRPDGVTVTVPIAGSEPASFELKMKH
jgi:hypothetical protein